MTDVFLTPERALERVQEELDDAGVERVNGGAPLLAATIEQAHVARARLVEWEHRADAEREKAREALEAAKAELVDTPGVDPATIADLPAAVRALIAELRRVRALAHEHISEKRRLMLEAAGPISYVDRIRGGHVDPWVAGDGGPVAGARASAGVANDELASMDRSDPRYFEVAAQMGAWDGLAEELKAETSRILKAAGRDDATNPAFREAVEAIALELVRARNAPPREAAKPASSPRADATYFVVLDHPDGDGHAIVRASDEDRAEELALGTAVDGALGPIEGLSVAAIMVIPDGLEEGALRRCVAGRFESRLA